MIRKSLIQSHVFQEGHLAVHPAYYADVLNSTFSLIFNFRNSRLTKNVAPTSCVNYSNLGFHQSIFFK